MSYARAHSLLTSSLRKQTKLSSPGLTGRSSTPRRLDHSRAPLEYWIPAFAGMTDRVLGY